MDTGWTAVHNRLRALASRATDGIERALAEEHTVHEVAASFAFGVLYTALPTAGTAIVAFALIAYFVDRASKLALVATLVIFNPVVKWAVYGASYWLGARLLGPVPGVSVESVSASAVTLDAGFDVVLRQLFGNALLATVMAVAGYFLVRAAVLEYRRRHGRVVDDSTARASDGGESEPTTD